MNAMKILSNARPGFLNAFADALVFVAAVPTPGDIECGVVSAGIFGSDVRSAAATRTASMSGRRLPTRQTRHVEWRSPSASATARSNHGPIETESCTRLRGAGQNIGGEAGVPGRPLSNPKLSDAYCEW